MRERRYPKFEILGSTFRRPRTSEFGPSPVPLVPPVSPGYSAWCTLVIPDVQTGEIRRALRVFPQPTSTLPARFTAPDTQPEAPERVPVPNRRCTRPR